MRNFTRQAWCVILLIGGLGPPCGLTQETDSRSPSDKPPPTRPERSADLDAIRARSRAFVEAFNQSDAKAIAALWIEDGEYVDGSRRTFTGRRAIETGYAQFFAEHPGHEMRLTIKSLKLLSDTTAIEDGHAILDPEPEGTPTTHEYLAIHVKVGGKWLRSTVRDTRVPTPPSYHNLRTFAWLIGTWIGEQHGATFESVCSWVANKSFIEQKYTLTQADGTATSGVQLIGWNPETSQIQSWTFSDDGGHSLGTWNVHEGGWSVDVRGVRGDGIATKAVNQLNYVGENAYSWQSTERTAGGQALPDTDKIHLKRKAN